MDKQELKQLDVLLYHDYGELLNSAIANMNGTNLYKAAGIFEKIAIQLREHGRGNSELGLNNEHSRP